MRDGQADLNGDGYITFTELAAYIQPAASKYNQTPGVSELMGHEQGDFVFLNPARRPLSPPPPSATGGPTRSADVYDLLKAGKVAFAARNYAAAVVPLTHAAELGNAEAMTLLGKLHWEGWGVPRNQAKARTLLEAAAGRGDIDAMAGLAQVSQGVEAQRWRTAVEQAEQLKRSISFIDPTGKADRGEPPISSGEIRVAPPAPTNLQIR